jgi:hypothetical protein
MIDDHERRHLAQADRHIAQCKRHIARQKQLLEQIRQRGQPTEWAEHMLMALKGSLRAFEKHRKLIVSAINAERRR